MPILEKIALGSGIYFVASFFAAIGVGRFLRIASRETFPIDQSSESLINLSNALGKAGSNPFLGAPSSTAPEVVVVAAPERHATAVH